MVNVEIIKNYPDAELKRTVKIGETLKVTEERAKTLTNPNNAIKTVVARVISIEAEETKEGTKEEIKEEVPEQLKDEKETKNDEAKKSKKKTV